jgi:hypothetical protein
MIKAFAFLGCILSGISGFLFGTSWQIIHPLNQSLRITARVLGIMGLTIALLAMLGVARA